MKFHKEGRASIFLAILISISLLVGTHIWLGEVALAMPIAMAIAAFLMLAVLQFFRNPPRRFVQMDEAIIAPADGKVVVIEEVHDEEFFNDKVKQISIFMSPTNVHINWYPVNGKVTYSKYHPGKFLVAWHPKSSTENERHSVVVESKTFGPILSKQIAGAVARRIVNYAQEDNEVEQGHEMGFIKFGSRVDILIPTSANVQVKLEEKTVGGQTILATL